MEFPKYSLETKKWFLLIVMIYWRRLFYLLLSFPFNPLCICIPQRSTLDWYSTQILCFLESSNISQKSNIIAPFLSNLREQISLKAVLLFRASRNINLFKNKTDKTHKIDKLTKRPPVMLFGVSHTLHLFIIISYPAIFTAL